MFHVEHSRPRLPDFSAAQNFIAIRSVSCETLRHPLYVVYGGMKKTGVQFEKCFTWNVFTASHNETNNRVITTYHQLLDVKFALNIRVEAFLYNCFPLLLMYTNGLGEDGGEVFYGSESYYFGAGEVGAGGQDLGSVGDYIDVGQCKCASHFAEEGGFLVI